MNEHVATKEPTRFDPPEEGLWPGESIVWTRRAGTGFWVIFIGFLIIMGGPLLTALSFEEYGQFGASFFLILTLIGISLLLNSLIKTRRTRYYLTTERIVEARGGKIIKEIPLEHFAGRPLGQFLETRVTHRSNQRPVYAIRIYDQYLMMYLSLKGWMDLRQEHSKESDKYLNACTAGLIMQQLILGAGTVVLCYNSRNLLLEAAGSGFLTS